MGRGLARISDPTYPSAGPMDFITRAGRVLSASIIISSFYCSVARAYTINRFSSAIGVTLDAGEYPVRSRKN